MIEILDMGTRGVIGVRVSGEIDKSDIDRVIAAVTAEFDGAEGLCVYVEVHGFDGISFEALLEDLRFALPNVRRLRKKAVVSDKKWMRNLVAMGNRLFPSADIKHFAFDEAAEARTWVTS